MKITRDTFFLNEFYQMTYVNIFLTGNDIGKRKAIKHVVQFASTRIQLPPIITIYLTKMPQRIMGGIIKENSNKIYINDGLSEQETVSVLLHELVHIDQRLTLRLKFFDDRIEWDGSQFDLVDVMQLTNEQYLTLPWEQDAIARQAVLLDALTDWY